MCSLPQQKKLIKLCSNAGFSKLTEKVQFFVKLDDGVLIDDMKVTCREYTLPRNCEFSRVKGWIRGNTKIGPVLDVKICYHQKRYGVEIMIESLLGDKTASWVLVMSGIHKDVTETSFLLKVLETVRAGKPAARSKAKPKPTPTDTSSHVKREIKDEVKQEPHRQMSIPFHERQWIDMEPAVFSPGFLEVSKHMIRLLRHGEEVPRERDGAVKFDDVMEIFNQVSVHRAVVSFSLDKLSVKRRRSKEEISILLDSLLGTQFSHDSCTSKRSRDTQEEPSLVLCCKTMLPDDFAEYIYHIGNVTDMHSITNSGLILGGKRLRKERQCVFFAAVKPMDEHRFPEKHTVRSGQSLSCSVQT